MTATACVSDDELLGYARGALDGAGRDRIEAHVDACSRCLGLVGGLARGSNALAVPWAGPPPARLLAEGDVVAKRYLIRRALGAGAMGEVYEAEDRLLGKTIALKTLNAVVAANTNALARLRSEVALAHRVTHPNVCRIYDIGVDAGSDPERGDEPLRFLTMEYLEGRTLSAVLRDHAPLRFARAFPLLRQLASALAAAHEVGVIHRDLKGDNVMLVRDDGGRVRVVVTDFGLAGPVLPVDAYISDDSWPRSSIRAHVAPEQLRGKPANPATDVYAFGLLAYEVLTGRPPSPDALRAESLVVDFELPVEARRAGATGRWQRFLRHTLQPDARLRLPDGRALEAALVALEGRPPSTSRRWAYGALSLSLGAVGALLVWHRDPPSPIQPIVVESAKGGQTLSRPTAPAVVAPAAPAGVPGAAIPLRLPITRLRPSRHMALRTFVDDRDTAASPASAAPAHAPAGERDEIIRDLPPRAAPVASDDELADPFATRRAAAPAGAR